MLLLYVFMTGISEGKRFGWFAASLMAFNWMLAEIHVYKLMH